MKMSELGIIIIAFVGGAVGIWLLIGWFAVIVAAILAAICIALVLGALISIWERVRLHHKGR